MDKDPGITLDVFDCEVRHAGDLHNTIPRSGVNEWEIRLLATIHRGNDSIVNRKKVGTVAVNSRQEEYYRLVRLYGMKVVKATFTDLDPLGYEKWLSDQVELEDMARDEAAEKRQKAAIADQLLQQEQALERARRAVTA